jgi:LPS sulfotransferase NodH
MRSDDVDPIAIGREVMQRSATQLDRYLEQRASLPDVEIIDIPYERIRSDSEGLLAEIYDAAGLDLTEEASEEMARWSAKHPEPRLRRHQYSLERFGLAEPQINSTFADYFAEFGAYLVGSSPALDGREVVGR